MILANELMYFICAGILLTGLVFMFFYSYYKKTYRKRIVSIIEVILIIAIIIFIVKGILEFL